MNLVIQPRFFEYLWEDYGLYLLTSHQRFDLGLGMAHMDEISVYVVDYKGRGMSLKAIATRRGWANTRESHERAAQVMFRNPAAICAVMRAKT